MIVTSSGISFFIVVDAWSTKNKNSLTVKIFASKFDINNVLLAEVALEKNKHRK